MAEETRKMPEKPLSKMTVKELREVALEIPRDENDRAVADMHKEELLAFIRQARGIVEEKPSPRKKAEPKVKRSPAELKQLMAELKRERDSAREGQNRPRADQLRRRIGRLKKLSRKGVAP